MDTNYLVHHGVKGQQWGVRRYQNPDGSLTDAGKKKLGRYKEKQAKPYDNVISRLNKSKQRLNYSNLRYKNPAKWKKKMRDKGERITEYTLKKRGVLNMSYDDMRFEKKRRRARHAISIMFGLPGNFATVGYELQIQKERLERGSKR